MKASYIALHENGRLEELESVLHERMARCDLCPHRCMADRTAGKTGKCRSGMLPIVSSFSPHFGEESCLVGRYGSGTIFMTHCNLFCIFCQNYDISHGGEGTRVEAGQIAAIMLSLQQGGCHNINFVTPSHVIPQILEALPEAIEGGLRVPLVYNTGGYDRVSALRLLDGIVDIYMPDFKFWDPSVAKDLCAAPDYPERAREAIKEMHRQVGDLAWDARGVASRGLLIRHLVMPEQLSGTPSILRFIAQAISPNSYVNVMDQYHPCGDALRHPKLKRRITGEEFRAAMEAAREAGLSRLDDRHKHWVLLDW